MRQKPVLMRVQIVDEEGSVTPQTIRLDDILCDMTTVRSVLSDDLRHRLRAVYDKVGRLVTKVPRTEWVESFNVNAHPDQETRVWEAIVKAWESFGGGTWLSPKKSALTVHTILAVSLGIVDVAATHNVSDEFVATCRRAYQEAA